MLNATFFRFMAASDGLKQRKIVHQVHMNFFFFFILKVHLPQTFVFALCTKTISKGPMTLLDPDIFCYCLWFTIISCLLWCFCGEKGFLVQEDIGYHFYVQKWFYLLFSGLNDLSVYSLLILCHQFKVVLCMLLEWMNSSLQFSSIYVFAIFFFGLIILVSQRNT